VIKCSLFGWCESFGRNTFDTFVGNLQERSVWKTRSSPNNLYRYGATYDGTTQNWHGVSSPFFLEKIWTYNPKPPNLGEGPLLLVFVFCCICILHQCIVQDNSDWCCVSGPLMQLIIPALSTMTPQGGSKWQLTISLNVATWQWSCNMITYYILLYTSQKNWRPFTAMLQTQKTNRNTIFPHFFGFTPVLKRWTPKTGVPPFQCNNQPTPCFPRQGAGWRLASKRAAMIISIWDPICSTKWSWENQKKTS